MKLGRSRIGMSMVLLLGIATMGLGVPAGAAPGAPAAPQGVGNASCFAPAPHGFSDVPTTSFANTAISWLVQAGITTGTTPTTFTPQGNTTRAEMAVFLWRNAGEPAPAGQQNFTDVPTTSFANTAISWLVEAGITTGTTPTTFTPQANTTRADMAVFLWRYNCPDPNLGNVTTLAGNGTRGFADGPGNTAQFNNPYGVAFAPNGNIYVADTYNQRIRVTNPTTGQVTTLAGTGTEGFADGPGTNAQFNNPYGVAVAPNGTVYVADRFNNRIRATNPATGEVTTLAGNGTQGFADGPGNTAQFNDPTGVAVAPNGTVYVADVINNRIRAINPTTGQVTTLAGNGTVGFADGPGNTAQFNDPTGVAVAAGGTVYVADVSNNRIRAINPTTSRVSTLAGSGTEGFADGTGTNAQFNRPYGVAVAPNGTIYVADTDNHRIRKIT